MTIDDLVVETTYGPVRGSDDGRVRTWRGLRYAAPPVADLRFRAPQAPQPWTEVADATSFGPACPQPVFPNMPLDLGAPQAEDCLRLNIWASSNTRLANPSRTNGHRCSAGCISGVHAGCRWSTTFDGTFNPLAV